MNLSIFRPLLDLPYSIRILIAILHILISSILLYSRNNVAPGYKRLTLAITISLLNFAIPSLFSSKTEIISMTSFGLSTMWLTSFKHIGWAVGRGPLAEQSLTLSQFIATSALPITPVLAEQLSSSSLPARKQSNARQHEHGRTALGSLINLVLKTMLLCLVVYMLQDRNLPQIIKEILYALGLYSFISIIMNSVAILMIVFLNLEIAPHFDKPFLSHSLSDFWSRRWNLNTGYTMRFLIYDPICEGCLVKKKELHGDGSKRKKVSPWRRAVAVIVAMFVSGVMHEMFIIYLRGLQSRGYWLLFFSVQGPLLVLESVCRRMFVSSKDTWVLSKAVTVPCTLALLLWLGNRLFYPDIERMGIPEQVVASLFSVLWAQSTGV